MYCGCPLAFDVLNHWHFFLNLAHNMCSISPIILVLMFVSVSLDDSHEDPKVFFFLYNFGSMPFGLGENHEKVKEQISRFDQLIKREWKEKK
jgi:hypothetical protein